MENLKLTVSSTPHIRDNATIDDIMLDVILALMPATFAGVFYFGARALALVCLSVICCVAFEALYQIINHKQVTVKDFSAIVTGMLIALILPPTAPFYTIIIGSFVAIIITKQLFGGLGQNFMNPALISRAFLLASFPVAMTKYTTEKLSLTQKIADVTTSATPLSPEYSGNPGLWEHFTGRMSDGTPIGGSIGETCILALLLGFAYLLIRRVITWHIPVSYLGSVMLITLVFSDKSSPVLLQAVLSVCTGGVMLGAIFMATDYVTSPTTKPGKIIFGIGCGILTCLIRFRGGYPEGVTYAILFMNVLTPLLDRWTKPRVFGEVKNNEK